MKQAMTRTHSKILKYHTPPNFSSFIIRGNDRGSQRKQEGYSKLRECHIHNGKGTSAHDAITEEVEIR